MELGPGYHPPNVFARFTKHRVAGIAASFTLHVAGIQSPATLFEM